MAKFLNRERFLNGRYINIKHEIIEIALGQKHVCICNNKSNVFMKISYSIQIIKL